MSFYPRRPRKQEEKPEPVPAALAMLGAEFDAMPFGSRGEFLASSPEPPRPPVIPLVIEPADWAEEERRRATQEAEPETRPHPVEAMLASEGREPPAPNLAPPLTYPPLERPVFPAPNWREEDAERERERFDEPSQSLARGPAKRAPKPKRTPRLDQVRAMLATDKETP